jgi:hypothetical protein
MGVHTLTDSGGIDSPQMGVDCSWPILTCSGLISSTPQCQALINASQTVQPGSEFLHMLVYSSNAGCGLRLDVTAVSAQVTPPPVDRGTGVRVLFVECVR